MPIVAGIGGNSGNQTITMIVRAIAVGQLADIQTGRLLRKEIGVALANGLIWGSVMGLVSFLLYDSIGIGWSWWRVTLNLLAGGGGGRIDSDCDGKTRPRPRPRQFGADYRRNRLRRFPDFPRLGNGVLAVGRTDKPRGRLNPIFKFQTASCLLSAA